MEEVEVLIDTNFLLVPFQFKLDIFRELDHLIEDRYRLVVSSSILSELKSISKKLGPSGMAARFALKLIEVNTFRISTIKGTKPVDSWIVKYAVEKRAIVCTNDIALRKKLIKEKIKVICVKSKSKLGFI